MTDPVSAIGGPRAAMVEFNPHGPMQATLWPAGPAARPASGGAGMREAASTMGDLSDRMFAKGTEGPGAMLAGVERAALKSISPRDYLRASLVATDLSMHVSMSMMRFQLSTSLGSAATGLFNTLLKNRE